MHDTYEAGTYVATSTAGGWIAEVRELFRSGEIAVVSDPELLGRLTRRERESAPRLVGKRPKTLLRLWRLDYALWLIDRRGRSVTQAAVDAGFYDTAHLDHTCREFLGTTPRRFLDERGG